MEKQHIARINELSRLSRERILTEEEAQERHVLRQNYLKAFRAQFRGHIENTLVEYPDGTRVPLKDTTKKPAEEMPIE